MNTHVYLCGGINKLSDADCRDWREAAKELLGESNCLDPMRRDYRGREHECVNEIVAGDIKDIADCEAMLVNASKPSWGTAMEIRIGHEVRKYVVAFGAGDKPSPWLVHQCSALVGTLEEACQLIKTYTGIGMSQKEQVVALREAAARQPRKGNK